MGPGRLQGPRRRPRGAPLPPTASAPPRPAPPLLRLLPSAPSLLNHHHHLTQPPIHPRPPSHPAPPLRVHPGPAVGRGGAPRGAAAAAAAAAGGGAFRKRSGRRVRLDSLLGRPPAGAMIGGGLAGRRLGVAGDGGGGRDPQAPRGPRRRPHGTAPPPTHTPSPWPGPPQPARAGRCCAQRRSPGAAARPGRPSAAAERVPPCGRRRGAGGAPWVPPLRPGLSGAGCGAALPPLF